MKSIFIIIAILSSFCANAQLPAFESDKIWKGLKIDTIAINISRIRIENYEVENDSISLRKFWAVEEHVYENGKIDSVHFLSSYTDSVSMSYFFDEHGRILGQRRYGKKAWYPIINYNYNEQELTTSETTFNQDSTPNLKTTIQYNTELKPMMKKEFKEDSVLRRYWIYEYDSCKNLIKQLYVNTPNGPGVSAFGGPFEPWPNDTTIYEITYKESCQVRLEKEFSNSDLEKTHETYFSGDTLISRTLEYSFDGEVSKEFYNKRIGLYEIKGTLFLRFTKSSFVYVYEDSKLKQYKSTSNGQPRTNIIYRTDLELDEQGNWIKRTIFENDEPTRIIRRRITYE